MVIQLGLKLCFVGITEKPTVSTNEGPELNASNIPLLSWVSKSISYLSKAYIRIMACQQSLAN